jgi:uncharacterized protein
MKIVFRNIFLCWILFVVPLMAATIPKYQGYVTDLAGVLSSEQRSQMEGYSTRLAQKTGVQVATLIVPNMSGMSIEDYANQVFASWRIGNKEDQGVLFVVAVAEKKLRYEVGYGAEAWLNDGKAGALLDTYVLPLMKQNAISQAVLQGHLAVLDAAATEFKIDLGQQLQPPSEQTAVSGDAILIFVGILIFLGIVTRGRIFPWLLLVLMSSSRGGGRGGSGGFGGGRSGGGGSSRGW